ncbi:hypothetical protein V1264_008872 [Littorina saxatilis]|uniref:Uncharacterized protein n=1 Tax=Littorina saxatilis TaxID=31220 RepID=A0AAN9AQH1_9CAEN
MLLDIEKNGRLPQHYALIIWRDHPITGPEFPHVFIRIAIYELDPYPQTTDPLLPVILLDKTGVVLKETEAATQTRMMKITCKSSDGADLSVRLAGITPSFPCSTCFIVLPCSPDFCLTYLAGQGTLNARQASHYQVTYSCTDSDGRNSSSTADVFIQPNETPYFDETTYPGLKGRLPY